MRHLMSPLDLTKEELDDLLTLASARKKLRQRSMRRTLNTKDFLM